jgi:hypothetical protein
MWGSYSLICANTFALPLHSYPLCSAASCKLHFPWGRFCTACGTLCRTSYGTGPLVGIFHFTFILQDLHPHWASESQLVDSFSVTHLSLNESWETCHRVTSSVCDTLRRHHPLHTAAPGSYCSEHTGDCDAVVFMGVHMSRHRQCTVLKIKTFHCHNEWIRSSPPTNGLEVAVGISGAGQRQREDLGCHRALNDVLRLRELLFKRSFFNNKLTLAYYNPLLYTF